MQRVNVVGMVAQHKSLNGRNFPFYREEEEVSQQAQSSEEGHCQVQDDAREIGKRRRHFHQPLTQAAISTTD